MATDRFYRLSNKKQSLIQYAAFQELARVPYSRASINQIVKAAHISRGSFYTYFDNKQDLYETLLKDIWDGLYRSLELDLEKSRGDIWHMYERQLDYCLGIASDKDWFQIFKHLNEGGSQEIPVAVSLQAKADFELRQKQIIWNRLDLKQSGLSKLHQNDIGMIHEAVCIMLVGVTSQFLQSEIDQEQAKNKFHKFLIIIQNGVKDKEEEIR